VPASSDENSESPTRKNWFFEDGGQFNTWFPSTNPRAKDGESPESLGVAPLPIPATLPPVAVDTQVTIRRGDTLKAVLTRAGIPGNDVEQAIRALKKVYDPRQLKPGFELFLQIQPPAHKNGKASLISIDFIAGPEKDVSVINEGGGQFLAEAYHRTLTPQLAYGRGTIDSSLYLAGTRAKVPAAILANLISLYSFDVDFQRDIQPGDAFELSYEILNDEAGTPVRNGDILVASMTLSGNTMTLYRFKTESGFNDYFDETGQSAQKSLLRTPTDAARISSGFGRRKHPVLGYTKIHRGIDFAAPPGTPIYAAGDGVVEKAGWAGGYGKYIRLRHNGAYKSAYAHMRQIARGIKVGVRVKQRQIIGYIGATGRVTGPHLHYEVIRNGRQVNPQTVRLPAGNHLKGAELARFEETVSRIKEKLIALRRQRDAQSMMISGDRACQKSASGC
jgi:murein DD-endopeptidase MepM/ murein hydrolase activator NlpD